MKMIIVINLTSAFPFCRVEHHTDSELPGVFCKLSDLVAIQELCRVVLSASTKEPV